VNGSTIVSIIALVVSLGTLGWQITRERWERPVVSVGGMIGSRDDSQARGAHHEYRIDVTNVGERAVTLIQAGVITNREVGSFIIHGLSQEEVAEFPIRLEPHDSRSWTILGGPVSRPSSEYEPWVKVVQRPAWWERRRGTLPERTIIGRLYGSLGARAKRHPEEQT
jgi:hypothetical protein